MPTDSPDEANKEDIEAAIRGFEAQKQHIDSQIAELARRAVIERKWLRAELTNGTTRQEQDERGRPQGDRRGAGNDGPR